MKLDKALSRDRKKGKKSKMVVTGKSVFIIEEVKVNRDKELRKRRKEKQQRLQDDL